MKKRGGRGDVQHIGLKHIDVRQEEAAGVDQLTRLEAERRRQTDKGEDGWMEGVVLIAERSCRVSVMNVLL